MTTLTDFDEIFKAFHTSPSKLIFLTFQIKKKKRGKDFGCDSLYTYVLSCVEYLRILNRSR